MGGMQPPALDRQRDILRRVVEEYVATGQPVGSKTLVERSASRFALDRARRARGARAARPAHASAHFRGARPDGGGTASTSTSCSSGPSRGRTSSARPPARAEVEEALQATTEMLSQVTRLLALVSAPPLEAATVRHVEVLLLQPDVVIVVVIASRAASPTCASRSRSRSTQGLVDWAGEYLDERRPGARSARAPSGARSTSRSLRLRERAFLEAIRGAFEQAADENRQLFVGGAAGLLEEMRAEEIGAYRSLMERAREARACSTCSRSPRPAAAVRRGSARSSSSPASRARARRRAPTASRTDARLRQPSRAAAHGLREGAPLGPRGGARALPLRRGTIYDEDQR